MSAFAGKRSSEPGEVAGRRLTPSGAIGVLAIQVHEQTAERANVLVVVPDHVGERPGFAPAQVVEVARWNLPATDIAMAAQAQQLRFDGGQPGVRHSMLEDTPHDRQEVKVPVVERGIRPGHSEAGDQQWPIEAAAVVRDQPAVPRDSRRQLCEKRRLVRVVRQEKLDLPEQAAVPPPEPDEEGQRPGGRREAGRLRVETEQRSVCRRLTRQSRQSLAIERQQRRRRLDHDERAESRPDQLAVDSRCQPLRADAR